MARFLYAALAAVALSGVISLFIFGAVQQSFRQSANDPQIQMVEDAVTILNNGTPSSSFTTSEKINVGESLAPFIVIYDTNGRPMAGNGFLHGALLTPPQGVFTAVQQVRGKGPDADAGFATDEVTLQTETGVRIASAILPYKDGFVLAGRSLREIELRTQNLLSQVIFGWIVLSATSIFLLGLGFLFFRSKTSS